MAFKKLSDKNPNAALYPPKERYRPSKPWHRYHTAALGYLPAFMLGCILTLLFLSYIPLMVCLGLGAAWAIWSLVFPGEERTVWDYLTTVLMVGVSAFIIILYFTAS